MSFQEYCTNMRSLNNEQREIVMYCRSWCKKYIHNYRNGKKVDGFRVFLSGSGGTGKSHVVKMIQRDMCHLLRNIVNPEPDQPLVLITAPTGSAAFNIGGSTVHVAFSLYDKSRAKLTYKKRCLMQLKLEHLMLLITDEISMVGFDLFQQMNEAVCGIKGSVNGDWAGICLLAVGDLYQLPPVAASPIYMNPRKAQTLSDMAPNGWETMQLHELKQIMRQKDNVFAEALNRIRRCTPEEGSIDDLMLKSQQLKFDHTHDTYPLEAMHVYAKNSSCDEWNKIMLDRINSERYIHLAVDSAKDTGTNLANVNISDNPRDTGNLRKVLIVKVGARVMLTTNVDVSDGLTNGVMGTVTHVVPCTTPHKIRAVLVKFDNDRVGSNAKQVSMYKHIDKNSVPIEEVQTNFSIGGRSTCQANRKQFPLTLSWAVTIHMCQGLTLPEIVVDMSPSKGRFSAGQAYVAFSCVRELNKLHIVNYTRSQIRVSPHVEAEMARLQENRLQFTKPLLYTNKRKDFCLLHVNIYNIKSKLRDIQCDEIFSHVDVISFNETHLSKQECLSGTMPGTKDDYSVFRRDRDGVGGGVALFVKSACLPLPIPLNTSLEVVAVKLSHPVDMTIVSVYRPPTTNLKHFTDEMCAVIANIHDKKICVVGDFNVDVLSKKHTIFSSMFQDNGYIQVVSEPTRDSGTLIDHVYVIGDMDVTCDVIDCYYSDHDFVMAMFSWKKNNCIL